MMIITRKLSQADDWSDGNSGKQTNGLVETQAGRRLVWWKLRHADDWSDGNSVKQTIGLMGTQSSRRLVWSEHMQADGWSDGNTGRQTIGLIETLAGRRLVWWKLSQADDWSDGNTGRQTIGLMGTLAPKIYSQYKKYVSKSKNSPSPQIYFPVQKYISHLWPDTTCSLSFLFPDANMKMFCTLCGPLWRLALILSREYGNRVCQHLSSTSQMKNDFANSHYLWSRFHADSMSRGSWWSHFSL